jgi:DNA-binding NarL/FixJ family response regulator
MDSMWQCFLRRMLCWVGHHALLLWPIQVGRLVSQFGTLDFLIGSHCLPRAALRALIESRPGFKITGEADSCSDAFKSSAAASNILLIDLPDAELAPLRELRPLLTAAPKARPIVLTIPLEPSVRTEIVRLGAMGLLSKDESPALLFTALETVARQHVAWIDRTTMAEVLRSIVKRKNKSRKRRSSWQDSRGASATS